MRKNLIFEKQKCFKNFPQKFSLKKQRTNFIKCNKKVFIKTFIEKNVTNICTQMWIFLRIKSIEIFL